MDSPTTRPADRSADSDGNSSPPRPTGKSPDPKPSLLRRYGAYVWVVGFLVVAVVGIGVYLFLTRMITGAPFQGPTWTVKKEVLRVTIVERGSLESAENSDITCRVKAKSAGSTVASTIKWVLDDGTRVKQGDLVAELDDSGFQENLKTQRNTVNKAYSDWVGANNDTTIQESQNVSDIKTAEVNLIQSELELKKYAGESAGARMIKMPTQEDVRKYLGAGFEDDVRKESSQSEGKFTSAYLQDISVIEGTIETARSDKDSWLDRAAWSQRMVKKGFYSLSQADADQSRLQSMEIALRKAQGDLDIYRIFEREKNVTKKWSDVKEAERALKRVDIQANSKMKQKQADEASKKAIYDQELDRLRDMEKEEKFYKITSPQEGMIVYYVPETVRFGSGTQQSIISQGEPVREGQKMIRIPNLSKMMVSVRVHEAMVSKVEGEITRPTGYGETLRLGFNFGRQDLIAMASYQVAFEELHDKFRDKEQTILFPGQEAAIRVEAFPGKQYRGHVKTKAQVASQADVFGSDVKVYTTMVSIDNLGSDHEKLKPGMSAEVTILADETKAEVIVIPIQSVIGNVAMGADRKCYVLGKDDYPQLRDIVIGKSNDKLVEIKSGLIEGEKVVLNPRPLIPANSDMKPATPGTGKGAALEGGGKKDKKGDMPQGAPSDGKSSRKTEK